MDNYTTAIKKLTKRINNIQKITHILLKKQTYIGEHAVQLFGSPKLAKLYYHVIYDILGGAEDKHIFHDGPFDPADVGNLDSATTGTDACFASIASGKDVLNDIAIMDDKSVVKATEQTMKNIAPKHTLKILYTYFDVNGDVCIQLTNPMTLNILIRSALDKCNALLYELDSRLQLMKTRCTLQAKKNPKDSDN